LRRELLGDLAAGVRFVSTRRVYRDNADWARERVLLHGELLGRLLEGESTQPSAATDAVYLTIGLPGSGKSRGLRPLALAHAGLQTPQAVSDADDVRVSLPEYAEGLGSGVLQEETQTLTYGSDGYPRGGALQDRVEALGGVVVVDIVGSPQHLPRVVRRLAAAGRAVYLLMTECPLGVCITRAMRRALEPGGRYVPISVIEDKDGVPRAALKAALATGAVTGWGVVDTSLWPARLIEGDGTFDSVIIAPNRWPRSENVTIRPCTAP
jgi:hypothetical protein